jgi:hypothetical protein
MKLTFAQFSDKTPRYSGRHLVRSFAAALSVFFSTAVPALAEPVRFNQVVQNLSSSQVQTELKLNTLVSQDPGSKGSTQQSGPRKETAPGTDGGKSDSLLSGLTVTPDQQGIGVDIIEEGEVEGTICDCGEILIADGDFPKWPFFLLAAVPLVLINDCDSCAQPPTSTSTPIPPTNSTTPTPTPEPASLLLFGSGVLAAGAGLRRRYARAKLLEQMNAQEEK